MKNAKMKMQDGVVSAKIIRKEKYGLLHVLSMDKQRCLSPKLLLRAIMMAMAILLIP